jgi:hypothetical protein
LPAEEHHEVLVEEPEEEMPEEEMPEEEMPEEVVEDDTTDADEETEYYEDIEAQTRKPNITRTSKRNGNVSKGRRRSRSRRCWKRRGRA